MNIFILSYGRNGGTSLGRWLSLELDRVYIHEPFNGNSFHIYKNIDYKKENYVIKLEPEQLHNIDGNKLVIGLIRENIKDCAISHLRASQSNIWNSYYTITNEWIDSNANNINKLCSRIENQNMHIKNMNCDILLTYENLYETKSDFYKICKFFNIKTPKYQHLMDSKMKYRKFNKTSNKNII